MYTLFKDRGVKSIARSEMLPLFIALAVTELLFHFGSFILEATACFAIWIFTSYVSNNIRSLFKNTVRKRKMV